MSTNQVLDYTLELHVKGIKSFDVRGNSPGFDYIQ